MNGKAMVSRRRPKIGLVLSGGAARGLAHIGVISVLIENGIPVDLIAGASFGAIVGGYLAAGYSIEEIYKKAREFDIWTVRNRKRIGQPYLSRERAEEVFRRDLGNLRIDELKIPLLIPALDLKQGGIHIFKKEDLCTAILSSSAFPGLFDPIVHNGHVFIDGGILNSMLLKIASDGGADIVIYSDVSFFSIIYRKKEFGLLLNVVLSVLPFKKFKPIREVSKLSRLGVIIRILSLVEAYRKDCEYYRQTIPDVIITPELRGIRPLDFSKVEETYEAGRKAAEEKIESIRKHISD